MGVYAGTKVNRTSEVFSVDPANEKTIASRENLLTYSQDHSNAIWSSSTVTKTLVTDITAPDGSTTDVYELTTIPAQTNKAYGQSNYSVSAQGTYTYSFYVKNKNIPNNNLALVFLNQDNTANVRATFNFRNQNFGTINTGGGWTGTSSVQALPNGWYRIALTAETVSGTHTAFNVKLWPGGYTGSAGVDYGGFYIWGAQLERNSIVTPYVKTTDTPVARSTDTITDLSSSAVAGTKKGKVGYNPYTRTGTFEFNTSNSDFIEFSRNATIDITDNLTIETWVYPKSFVNVGGILTYGTGSGEQFALWTSNSNRIAFSTNWPNTWYQGFSQTLDTNEWYHVVATFSSGAWQIYINGLLSNSGTFAISTLPQVSNAYVTLGNNHPAGQDYFDGFLGATKVYNRVLGGTEIIDNYNSFRTRYGYRTQTFELPSDAIGLTQSNPASSAAAIKAAYPYAPDGVYWINLPTSGATRIYCLMDDTYDGGGWMLMMKATRGTTFQYTANYWTTDNTLNATSINLDDGDAKYDVMNKFEGKDFLAIWPDITQNGGSLTGKRGWTWLQNNYNDGTRITPISFFNITYSPENPGGSGKFIQDAKTYSGWASGVFSSQRDVRFYGFNYAPNARGATPYTGGQAGKVRWGFGWNENGEGLYPSTVVGSNGTNDVSGGIGMDTNYDSYSAGDHINCCQDGTGINRSARVELYVR